MSNLCILFGEIPVKSERDAKDFLKIIKRRMFIDTYEYSTRKNMLVIDVGFDKLKHINWLEKYVYKKLAECIPDNCFGKLYFKEGQFFSCVYFGNRKFEVIDYELTETPSWWNGNKR